MRAKVVSNSWVKGSCYKLVLENSCDIFASPGQFLMIRPIEVEGLSDPLLSRPFSIHRIIANRQLQILYKVVGKGTGLLSGFIAGSEMEVLAPLGRGFYVDGNEQSEDTFIVAGGIGVAPLVSLAEDLRSRYPQMRIIVFIGGREEGDLLCVDELQSVSDEVIIATDDGSYGYRGYVTEAVREYLETGRMQNQRKPSVYACGPTPMLQRISEMAEPMNLRTYFSLEASMACGIGLCMGCAVKAKKGGYYLVCTDGPVFRGDEISL